MTRAIVAVSIPQHYCVGALTVRDRVTNRRTVFVLQRRSVWHRGHGTGIRDARASARGTGDMLRSLAEPANLTIQPQKACPPPWILPSARHSMERVHTYVRIRRHANRGRRRAARGGAVPRRGA